MNGPDQNPDSTFTARAVREKAMKILVVDGSSSMRKIVTRTLRQAGFGGHDIEEAEKLGLVG